LGQPSGSRILLHRSRSLSIFVLCFRGNRSQRGALALGAAGASLTRAGGASATAPTAPSKNTVPGIILAEEEISDVSFATFYVFDKENESPVRQGIRVAAGYAHGSGCGDCGGCGHGGGCRGGPWLCSSTNQGAAVRRRSPRMCQCGHYARPSNDRNIGFSQPDWPAYRPGHQGTI
jgi:hypothetical protein